jgi:exopolyphosphatase/guanosine-5'-triphosphate,3'-diphosphate pyrophosphatase
MWRLAPNRSPAVEGPEPAETRHAAVIDIGSNSIRLVVYRLEGRTIWTAYNEKALAGLGRDLQTTGRLSPEGVETAMAVLRRFRVLLQGWSSRETFVVATAAVREARDSRTFLRAVEDETGISVRVLSGEEEARYSALGVLAGQSDAHGVAGDLGGFSLELVRLDGPGQGVSLPLGPLALGAPRPMDAERVRRSVARALRPHAERLSSREFHAVGGAWRNLALLHMELEGYPLHIAHQYEIQRMDLLDMCRFVARQSRSSLEGIRGLSRKRFDTLPYAAVVLSEVVQALEVQRVVISAFGIREGLLLESMPETIREQDPLIAGCEALVAQRGLTPGLGPAMEDFLRPVFANLAPAFGARDPILLSAACRLADLGARLHPDHRANLAFDKALRAPIAGMSHPERAFLACTVFSRHDSSAATPEPEMVARLLTPERRARARALGAAIRLGCDLAGRNVEVLRHARLNLDGDRLRVFTEPGWEDMLLGEQAAKRALTLAQTLKTRLQMG